MCWARCTYFSPPYVGEYDMVAINGNSLYICAVFMLHTIHAFCITGKKSFKINGMAIFVRVLTTLPRLVIILKWKGSPRVLETCRLKSCSLSIVHLDWSEVAAILSSLYSLALWIGVRRSLHPWLWDIRV